MIRLRAPAKLNLFLRVLGRRADGYHEIETVFERLDLADALTFESHPDAVCLTCTDPSLSCGADNLILKAAQLLQRVSGTARGARIHLEKHIPIAAGLGGGSSDAAATLVGLNRLWGLGLDRAALQPLAAQLGSDVPFFLIDAPFAIGRGRGAACEPLPTSCRLTHVLVTPPHRLSTRDVYAGLVPEASLPVPPGNARRCAAGTPPQAVGASGWLGTGEQQLCVSSPSTRFARSGRSPERSRRTSGHGAPTKSRGERETQRSEAHLGGVRRAVQRTSAEPGPARNLAPVWTGDFPLTAPGPSGTIVPHALRNGSLGELASGLWNDLEPEAIRRCPVIATIHTHARRLGCLGSLVSGSGPSVFGLCRDRGHADDIARRLRELGEATWRIEVVQTALTQPPVGV